MTGRVPLFPPIAVDISGSANRVRIAAPVYGEQQWRQFGGLANFLLGRGGSLVASGPVYRVPEDSDEVSDPDLLDDRTTAHFYIWPRVQNFARLWCVTITKIVEGNRHSGTIEIPDGTELVSWEIPTDWPANVPRMFFAVQTVDPPSGTAGPVTVTVTADAGTGFYAYVQSITCTEIPRNLLDDFGGEFVPDLDSLRSGRSIYDDDAIGPGAVCRAMVLAKTQARRSCLYSMYYPPGSVAQTDSSFDGTSDIFGNTYNAPTVVPRRLLNDGLERRAIAWAARVATTGGSGSSRAEIRVTSVGSGDADTVTIPTGTVWVTGTVDAYNADPTAIDDNRLIVELAVTSATNVKLYGFCAAETD